jgi:glycosyltransferase involved in cell wall biosynthesis
MDFSIVVPFYNEEENIEKCIKALLSQNYAQDKYEILMVDNNSSDRSAEIVQHYPTIKLLSEERQGDFAARNQGIKRAKGEIIAFTDSDTAPFSDWLQNIAVAMLNPNVCILVGKLQYPEDSWALSMIATYEAERASYTFSTNIQEIYYGYTCNMAIRKKLFERLGLFPAIYRNSDIVFLQRAIDAYSCDVTRYSSEVRVRRLEISSLWKYYKKQHLYGKDFQRYRKFSAARPLNGTERLRVFKSAIKRSKYSLAKSALLFSLLFGGGICYELGRSRAAKVEPSGEPN